ncbi:MAG TPA: hypothetical protein VH601_23730 [Bryobacteraceae bacterium]
MQYRLLGNSGLRVSEAALGAMTFGEDWGWGAGKEEARELYNAFREAGLRKLDEASRIELGFPHDFYAKDLVRGFLYGGMRDALAMRAPRQRCRSLLLDL